MSRIDAYNSYRDLIQEFLNRRVADPEIRAQLQKRLPRKRQPGRPPGTPAKWRAWESTEMYVDDAFAWMDERPDEEIPPHLKAWAKDRSVNPKTVSRWTHKAGYADWDAFVAAWMRSRLNGHVVVAAAAALAQKVIEGG